MDSRSTAPSLDGAEDASGCWQGQPLAFMFLPQLETMQGEMHGHQMAFPELCHHHPNEGFCQQLR